MGGPQFLTLSPYNSIGAEEVKALEAVGETGHFRVLREERMNSMEVKYKNLRRRGGENLVLNIQFRLIQTHRV